MWSNSNEHGISSIKLRIMKDAHPGNTGLTLNLPRCALSPLIISVKPVTYAYMRDSRYRISLSRLSARYLCSTILNLKVQSACTTRFSNHSSKNTFHCRRWPIIPPKCCLRCSSRAVVNISRSQRVQKVAKMQKGTRWRKGRYGVMVRVGSIPVKLCNLTRISHMPRYRTCERRGCKLGSCYSALLLHGIGCHRG